MTGIYMRASMVGINMMNANVLEIAFLSVLSKVMLDFEDIDLMFCLKRFDIQFLTVLCL